MEETCLDIESAWLDYQQRLLSFIQSRVDSIADAEDIRNNVFTKLVTLSNQDQFPDNVSAWLYRVTRNQIVDYYRVKKPTQELPEDLQHEQPDKGHFQELSQCMVAMIESLPEEYQQVLIRSEINQQKQQQVADDLGLSLAATKSRIQRGRRLLKDSVTRCCSMVTNSDGSIVDYVQKSVTDCGDCSQP